VDLSGYGHVASRRRVSDNRGRLNSSDHPPLDILTEAAFFANGRARHGVAVGVRHNNRRRSRLYDVVEACGEHRVDRRGLDRLEAALRCHGDVLVLGRCGHHNHRRSSHEAAFSRNLHRKISPAGDVLLQHPVGLCSHRSCRFAGALVDLVADLWGPYL